MILTFTTDDLEIVEKAYGEDQAIYGIAYCYLKGHSFTGLLGKTENLFISAHGNEEEIGNEEGDPSYTPAQLAKVLTTYVLPGTYTGSIFVSACNSAPEYVNNLLDELGGGFKNRINGVADAVPYKLEPPKNAFWILAI